MPVNFLQAKSLYSGPAPGPAPLKTTTGKKGKPGTELKGMGALLRQGRLHSGKGCMEVPQPDVWFTCTELAQAASALHWATGWARFICSLLTGG